MATIQIEQIEQPVGPRLLIAITLLACGSCADGEPRSIGRRERPPEFAASELRDLEGQQPKTTNCRDDDAALRRVCISTLPDGVTDCAACDRDCVRQMLRVDARKAAKAGTGAQDWPEVTALSCRHSAEAVEAGCCFHAVVDGSNTIFVD